MNPILLEWSWPAVPLIGSLLAAGIYLRGWQRARRTRPHELPPWRAACFLAGLASLWIALASPIDALDDRLLAAHMIQHFLLMSVAPPLLVLGAPTVPILRGLPRAMLRAVRPLFAARWLHRLTRFLLHPATVWIAMNVAYLGWHVPAAFELTFRSEGWHQFEHGCFFVTNLAFWWVVLEPWPAHWPPRTRWPRWATVPYLLTADIANTVLSALLTFSGRVLYPSYAAAQRISVFGGAPLTPLQDQAAAGAEMWVLNSTIFLVPAIALTIQLLSPAEKQQSTSTARVRPAG